MQKAEGRKQNAEVRRRNAEVRVLLLYLFLPTSAFLLLTCFASATTYYVDPAGSNGNDGLSPATPWRTLLKVGISTFQPGDVILFKRDGVWNEWLTPPSSGTAGNLIKFDAYSDGRPPEFTGYFATTALQWSNISENVWQITLSATQIIDELKFVQFGTLWGNAQTAQNELAHNRDWYYDATNQILYVYSSGGNPVTAFGSVTPIILSGQSLININGVSYIDAISSRQIVDEAKFKEGLSKVIDGAVECLNASIWAKAK